MKSVNATDAKNNFGELLDSAQAGPVTIQKNGGDVAVVISIAEYTRSQAADDNGVNPLVKNAYKKSLERYSNLYKTLVE